MSNSCFSPSSAGKLARAMEFVWFSLGGCCFGSWPGGPSYRSLASRSSVFAVCSRAFTPTGVVGVVVARGVRACEADWSACAAGFCQLEDVICIFHRIPSKVFMRGTERFICGFEVVPVTSIMKRLGELFIGCIIAPTIVRLLTLA